jgi:integrating conjugative element protein (TIGR03759 family)
MKRTNLALAISISFGVAFAGVTVAIAAPAQNTTRIQTADQSVSMQQSNMNNAAADADAMLKSLDQWTSLDQAQAQSWKMSQSEWKEYKRLMAFGPNSAFYASKPGVTPLWIMGFNAKSEAERADFARRAFEQEQERLAKEILFDEAWNKHLRSLTPNHPIWMTDTERRAYFKSRAEGGSGAENRTLPKITDTRVVAYVDAKNCNASCEDFIRGFLSTSTKLNRLDLFVLNASDKDSILAFGSRVGVTSEKLSERIATLNFDNGYYARLQPAPGLPVAYRVSLSGTQKIKP